MEAIRFGTDGWRATAGTFTAARVRAVGQAVATYLDDEGIDGAVGVGYDAREGSRGFAEELARVLCANGRDVLLPGRDRPTPLLAWAVVDRGLAGGVMVTASHNPPEYNGVKFIPADGAPALPAVTDALEARLADPSPGPEATWGRVREVDLVGPHADQARGVVLERRGRPSAGLDLDGLRVCYDAMHGSGRGVTDALLEAAGARVERVRVERDPSFGGTPPEPSAEHLGPLVEAVGSTDADLGLANDGDADRIGLVTPGRGVVDPNLVYALLYEYLLRSDAGPAVRTVSTTSLIDRIAEAHGERVVEVPVGFKWVAAAMADADALVGGEESGGFSVRGHVREKDGVLLALLLAVAAAERPLDERLDTVRRTYGGVVQSRTSLDCPEVRKAAVLDGLGHALPESVGGVAVAGVNDADGFKVALEDGSWLLVRPSGTEPKLRIYAEAGDPGRVERLLGAGRDLVEPLI